MTELFVIQEKLGPDWREQLVQIQDELMKDQPFIAFMALTYPTRNTGHFMAIGSSDQYTSISISKHAFAAALGACFYRQPGLDT